jgi:AcrR family transcriptional regulator
VSRARPDPGEKVDRRTLILDSVLTLLARDGIAGVSMRAVSREAGVALGLVHYYFDDKTALISAALRRVEAQDLAIVAPEHGPDPVRRLRAALRRVADPEFLTTEYLSLRLQLWALAQVNEEFAAINSTAQGRYRAGLATLIHAARPELTESECGRRAADIDVLQNGVWLTSLLGLDRSSIRRSVARSEEIALGDRPDD